MSRTKINIDKQLTLDARRHLIIEDIASGKKYTDILRKYTNEWGLSVKSLELYIHDAIEFMRSDTSKENIIAMNMERLDKIVTDSIKKSDRKNAIKAIDVQNKLAGGYTEKVKIEGDSEINLKFDIGV